ncbi:MAG: sigma-70 family RNA polymerase sigma factor [Chitinophagaceae bacterium]|nr:sigma-70 family RNA polymerase sigma factor [Chitinophagaceae bacterium]
MSYSDIKSRTDEELIALFQQSGDNQWLGVLLERHTLLLLGIAMKYLKDKDQAHDAVQQVFIKTLTRFPENPVQNFKGWLYILMRNHCLGVLRSNSFRAPEELLNTLAAPETKTQEEWIHDELMRQNLHQALQSLNPDQQTCIRLFYIEKRSYKEIMEQTTFSFEQVKSYVQNGKRNLKIALQKINPDLK